MDEIEKNELNRATNKVSIRTSVPQVTRSKAQISENDQQGSTARFLSLAQTKENIGTCQQASCESTLRLEDKVHSEVKPIQSPVLKGKPAHANSFADNALKNSQGVSRSKSEDTYVTTSVNHSESYELLEFLIDDNVSLGSNESKEQTARLIIKEESRVGETFCRICHELDQDEALISPCKCKGSMSLVHTSCLEHWLAESDSSHCELCGFKYKTTRRPKYSMIGSVVAWFKSSRRDRREVILDILATITLAPMAGIGTYVGLLMAEALNIDDDVQNVTMGTLTGRVAALSVISLMTTLDVAYATWAAIRLQCHMVSIPPQSKLMYKYRFLEGYNDIKTCRDAHQAASNVVNKTMTFAEMCFNEEKGFKSYQSSLLLHDDSWPTVAEFNIFAALPKIDAFMKHKYPWLSNWSHSTRHLKEIIASKHLSFQVFEICYGAARISYPVVQSTFSVYFVFELNRFVDQGSECIVKYFLEGSDEVLIPYVNDSITQSQVKALLKVKLALSSTINLGSTVQMPDGTIRQLIHMKKQMLNDFRFVANTAASHETIPFPYTVHIQLNEKCSVHGKSCPIFRVKSHSNVTGTSHQGEDDEEDTETLSSDSYSKESFEPFSYYGFLTDGNNFFDKSKTKKRSRTVSIRTVSPGVYGYDLDLDDSDDDEPDDKKKEDEVDLEYDFDDDDDVDKK